MRRFLALFLMVMVACSLIINDAQARRFGGGRSFGVQRSVSSFSRPSMQAAAAPRSGFANKWLGPLAGLAAGGLLASLFMGNGFGGSILTLLIVAFAFLAIVNLIRRKMQASPQSAAHAYGRNPNTMRDTVSQFMFNNNQQASSAQGASFPQGFDADTFLRDAKVSFLRLQTAYDTKNLTDLREFTTPEVYAEIQLQLQERGEDENRTDVKSLETQILDVTTAPDASSDTVVASVRFSGVVSENSDHISTSFNEIWHFRTDSRATSCWLVAGIQQH